MVVPGMPVCSILKPSSLLAVKKAFTVVVYVSNAQLLRIHGLEQIITQ